MVYGCYIDVTLMFMGTCDIIMMPNQIKGMAERSARSIIREIRKSHAETRKYHAETKKFHAETLMFLKACDIITMPNQIKGMAERSARSIIRERSRVILFWEHGWTEKNVPVSREQRRQRIDPVSLRSILIALPLYMINSRDCTCAYL